MKKIERLISIVMILLQKKVVSASEFSQIFNVTKRTIQRDIESLGYANIPIYAIHGADGGYGLIEEYKFDKRLLNHRDIENIFIALGGFEQLITNQEIQETIQKIKGMTSIDISPKLHLTFYDWTGRSQINEEITLINQAIENKWLLKFDYIDQTGNKTNRIVEPYKMHLSEMHWYLFGYCLERKDYRTFKLTRILNIQKDGYFISRSDNKWQEEKRYIKQQSLFSVQLLIDVSVRDQFVERFGKSAIKRVTQNNYLATVELPENQFGFQFLAGFGNKIKIESPETFITNYLTFLDDTVKLYR